MRSQAGAWKRGHSSIVEIKSNGCLASLVWEMMILEGMITTKNADESFNVAPMGPRVDESFTTLILRPFQSSQTYRNLKEHPYGVFHVTDDVHLLARAAIGSLNPLPETFPAETIDGVILKSACRWYEFEIKSFADREHRTRLTAGVVHSGHIRDFFGFNRAKHAVVEAAILATRLHLLSHQDILDQFAALKTIVEKTAGPRESEAFDLLERYVTENDGNR